MCGVCDLRSPGVHQISYSIIKKKKNFVKSSVTYYYTMTLTHGASVCMYRGQKKANIVVVIIQMMFFFLLRQDLSLV